MAYFSKLLKLTRLQARLPIVTEDGTGTTAFVDLINRAFSNIERSDNGQAELLNQIAEILNIQRELKTDAEKAAAEKALVDSYTDPTAILTVTSDATSATVVIANHNRVYASTPPVTKAVTGKTFTGLALDTIYYFFYDDPARQGGAVNIMYSTNNIDAAQTGNRHSLGNITTPPGAQTDPVPGEGVPPRGGTPPRYKFETEPTVEE